MKMKAYEHCATILDSVLPAASPAAPPAPDRESLELMTSARQAAAACGVNVVRTRRQRTDARQPPASRNPSSSKLKTVKVEPALEVGMEVHGAARVEDLKEAHEQFQIGLHANVRYS
eukprot:3175874-Rhodomonas_salina.3